MQQIVNGVDVEKLTETVESVRRDPSLGEVTFRLDGAWQGGLKLSSQTGSLRHAGHEDLERRSKFSLECDEPAELLGDDSAVSPGEYLLQALAGCYAVTLASNAAIRNLQLEGFKLELEADFDLQGFLGTDPDVRPGASELRVRVSIDCAGASRKELEELVNAVEQHSPIRDTLANAVRVVTELA